MVVCPYFLQGTCKFGSRCYNEHIKNSNFPIFRQNRGGMRGGRGGRGGPPGPRFQQQPEQEPAYEFYERMACEQSQRLKNPKGRVTVASRYRNNQPQHQHNGGDHRLNCTIESKSSEKSNNGYMKHNGYESSSGRRRRHDDDDDDDDDLFNGDDDEQNLTQENESVSTPQIDTSDDEDDDDVIRGSFTTRRRRRPHSSLPASSVGSRATAVGGGSSLKPIKSSSPKSRAGSSRKDDSGNLVYDMSTMRQWFDIYSDEINFFRSCLPQMKALNDYQKSCARTRIQQVLHDARYQTVEKK